MRGRTHQLAPNCAAKQETRAARALFPKNTISRSVDSRAPNAHFDGEPDQRSRVFRSVHEGNSRPCWASECRPEMLDYPIRFRNATGAVQPNCGTREYPSRGFQFFYFNEATLASSKVLLASQRICRVQFSVEKRMENELPFRTGAGGTRAGFGDHDSAPAR
jgi:hypothetical protein